MLANAAEVGVERIAHRFVAKERETFLRREDQMDVHSGKRLRHCTPLDRTPLGFCCFMHHVPRVAALRQPWAESRNAFGVNVGSAGLANKMPSA